jgi:hypothetical protein
LQLAATIQLLQPSNITHLCGAHSLTELACDAALLSCGVAAQDVLATEAWADGSLLKGVVDLREVGGWVGRDRRQWQGVCECASDTCRLCCVPTAQHVIPCQHVDGTWHTQELLHSTHALMLLPLLPVLLPHTAPTTLEYWHMAAQQTSSCDCRHDCQHVAATHCDFGLKKSLDGVGHATNDLCHKQRVGTVIQDCSTSSTTQAKHPSQQASSTDG